MNCVCRATVGHLQKTGTGRNLLMKIDTDIDIAFDETNYRSDSICNGRTIKKFFKTLSTNIFTNALEYNKKHLEYAGSGDNPLLYNERNMYSLIATSIGQITPVHLSEWGFSKNDSGGLENNRRVDFWCMHKESKSSDPINFYIELKSGWYSLNKHSKINISKYVTDSIDSLTKQLRQLSKLKPKFYDFDDVYLGLFVFYGYYRSDEHYSSANLHDEFKKVADKRTVKNHLISTWIFPDDLPVQWEHDKCKFISIVGIPISKQKKKGSKQLSASNIE
jgi:hypothetical protein